MGYEGFSHAHHMQEMNLIMGNKREYLWLLAFMALLPILQSTRTKNEDGLAKEIKATNRYAKVNLSGTSSRIDTNWTA